MSISAYNPAMSQPNYGQSHADYYDRRDWCKIVSRLIIDDTTGCWNYTRHLNKGGYGAITTSKFGSIHEKYIHRAMYRFLIGPIPKGLHIDHLCRNRGCGNPMHMEAVTAAVNVLRGVGPCSINAGKTHCSNGHPYDGHNLIIKKRRTGLVYRACRICIYAMNKANYENNGGKEKARIRAKRNYDLAKLNK